MLALSSRAVTLTLLAVCTGAGGVLSGCERRAAPPTSGAGSSSAVSPGTPDTNPDTNPHTNGADPSPESPAAPSVPQALSFDELRGEWTLVAIAGDAIALPDQGRAPTLAFAEEGRFNSFAGVNRLSGGVDSSRLGEGTIGFTPGPMTLMGGPPELMALESGFVDGLTRARAARVEDGVLILSADGVELLRFQRSG